MKGSIEEILNELGWKNGFRIPVANEENKRLEEEVDKKIKQKTQLVQELTINEDRIKSIKEYISNIKIEHEHNQKLLTAYAAQYNAEEHIFRVSEHEESSIAQEIKNHERDKKRSEERITSLRKDMEKFEGKLTTSEKTVAFDKAKLLEWEQLLSKEEENGQLILKFMKLDSQKFKALELKRQQLTTDLDLARNSVLQTINEIREMEIILERTAGFYVQALEERRQLIDRWAQSVYVLNQRDNGIQEILREIDTLKEIANERMQILSESEEFMENQVNSNKNLNDLIKTLETRLFIEKEERKKIVENNSFYELEYQMRQKSLEDLSRRYQRLKIDLNSSKIDIDNKNKKIKEFSKQIRDIRGTIDEIDNQSVNIADRMKKLEEMLENEEKRKIIFIKEIKHFQGLILRTSDKINNFQGERKSLDIQKSAELKKIENLGIHENREAQRLCEKTEINGKLNYEIDECERKLGKCGPDSFNRSEMNRKIKLIEDLQKIFNEKIEISKLLQTQMINLEHDVRKLQSDLKIDNEELMRLQSKKQDVGLMMEGGEKQLKVAQKMNEEKQVAENILELRVTQAEQIIKNIGDKLYNLEKYRLQIDSAMRERMAETKVQKEGLNLEKRVVLSDCSDLRSKINERQTKMQHLQARYDNVIAALGTTEIDGTPVTTTYLKIQNAQEKAELQEQGDKLDADIRRTEQEIQSMENTLRIVNVCNEKYKSSLNTLGNDDVPEKLERKQLDGEMLTALEVMREKKNQLDDIDQDFQRMQDDFEKLMDDVKQIKEDKELKVRAVFNLEKQITEQKERISRADKNLRKLYKDIQRICENADDDTILLQEKDIATKELQEQNYLALQRITEFTIRHVEAEVYVKKLLSAKNIVLPCAQHLKPSPSPSLCDSSRSSFVSSGASRMPSTRESASKIHNMQSEFVFDAVGGSRTSKRLSGMVEKSASRKSDQYFKKK